MGANMAILKQDAVQLSQALKQKASYYHMMSDAVEVHGLEDWTEGEWTKYFEKHPDEKTKCEGGTCNTVAWNSPRSKTRRGAL